MALDGHSRYKQCGRLVRRSPRNPNEDKWPLNQVFNDEIQD